MSDPEAGLAPATIASVRWPRIAVTAVFVVHGLLFASWTAHIPDVQSHLGLTDGTLGFALLGAPVGSVTAMIAGSWLLPRVGSRRVVQVALVGYCATGPLVGLTGSLPALFARAAPSRRTSARPARPAAGRPLRTRRHHGGPAAPPRRAASAWRDCFRRDAVLGGHR